MCNEIVPRMELKLLNENLDVRNYYTQLGTYIHLMFEFTIGEALKTENFVLGDNMSKFQVDDEVFCIDYGEGIVISINSNKEHYPINVQFSKTSNCYTLDGRLWTTAYMPSLYHKGTKIVEFIPKRTKFKAGMKVFSTILGWGKVKVVCNEEFSLVKFSDMPNTFYFYSDTGKRTHCYFSNDDVQHIYTEQEALEGFKNGNLQP